MSTFKHNNLHNQHKCSWSMCTHTTFWLMSYVAAQVIFDWLRILTDLHQSGSRDEKRQNRIGNRHCGGLASWSMSRLFPFSPPKSVFRKVWKRTHKIMLELKAVDKKLAAAGFGTQGRKRGRGTEEQGDQRAILNFIPGPRGEICLLGRMFTPSFTPRRTLSSLDCLEEWWGEQRFSPPGDNFTRRGQNSPLGVLRR
jgi:hypothetical protein